MSSDQPEKTFTLEAFKNWGSEGGAKVKGEKKKRSKAHYKRISALGVAARKANRSPDSKPVVA